MCRQISGSDQIKFEIEVPLPGAVADKEAQITIKEENSVSRKVGIVWLDEDEKSIVIYSEYDRELDMFHNKFVLKLESSSGTYYNYENDEEVPTKSTDYVCMEGM